MNYYYLSTQRPISIGTFPKVRGEPIDFVNFDKRKLFFGKMAWGYLIYDYALTSKEMNDYELSAMPPEDKVLQTLEAAERMKLLNMHEYAINDFLSDGTLNVSVNGVLCWIEEEMLKHVADLEEKYGTMVYHVIHGDHDFGECLSMLFVSGDAEDWHEERNALQRGYPYAYVVNLSFRECSEFGGIRIKPIKDGFVRIV